MRQRLAALFRSVLADLDPAPAVRSCLRARRAEFAGADRVLLLAIGKAARPMARAALAELGNVAAGLLVAPEPDELPPLFVQPAGHPLPTEGSLRAGALALDLCRSAGPGDVVLYLLSGGGSSLCELPLDPTVPLDQWRALYGALVDCGAGIVDVNVVRKYLSLVKGGRLAAAAAAARHQLTLAVVDVPGDGLAALASGPTVGDDATLAQCIAIVHRFGLAAVIPAALRQRLERGELPPPLRTDDPRLARGDSVRLCDNDTAIAALCDRAERAGLRVVVDREADEMPCGAAATHLLARLHREAAHGAPVAVLAGGEVRIALPAQHGVGGRNQQFALHCAMQIQGQPNAVLSCGTDGLDGGAPAAGAVADGTTVARARALGLDADLHLRRCDAHPLFAALGDTIVTGPTGTNVRDLRALVWTPDAQQRGLAAASAGQSLR